MSEKVYKVITDKILESLDKGVVPWRMPWTTVSPRNLVSKKPYQGINVFMTACQGYTSPWWLTAKQAKDLGGSIKPEEIGKKYTPILKAGFYRKDPISGKWTPCNPKDPGARFSARYSQAYNVEQCDGIVAPVIRRPNVFSPIEECEKVVARWSGKPAIHHGGGRACYVPSQDLIRMPEASAFHSSEEYYSTLFHELTHSTGHENRLARKGITDAIMFGSHDYSYEELVAECGAAFLCGHTGIVNRTLDNSIAYIQNWSKKLKSDPEMVVKAANAAGKAANHIIGESTENIEEEDDSE